MLTRLITFLRHDLWLPAHQRIARLFRDSLRRLYLSVLLFLRERMQFRASALTYSLLFAFVPLLAIVFAIAKGFGLNEYLETQIRAQFASQPQVAEMLLGFVERYLVRAQGGVFLGFGILLLLWTLYSLTSDVEATFNQIWQVRKDRSLSRRVTDYAALIFLLPVFLVLSLGLSIFLEGFVASLPHVFLLHTSLLTLLRLVPYLLMVLFTTGLYLFIPNTRVSVRSAFVAGLPAGLLLQGLMNLYVYLQMILTGYNAIYGSFAALPLMMLLMQIGWYILLFGACLAYADQHIGRFYYGRDNIALSPAASDHCCLQAMQAVCKAYAEERPPFSLGSLTRELRVPEPVGVQTAARLVEAGLLSEYADTASADETRYLPAFDIHRITSERVLRALHGAGEQLPETHEPSEAFNAAIGELYADEYWKKPLTECEL
ncbi:MAG: YihY/virulence factor BrkB family protein [Alloprevotella sp.]|nr:YihY/virulence factor BrkB family protein [Alloprevotella sp.]